MCRYRSGAAPLCFTSSKLTTSVQPGIMQHYNVVRCTTVFVLPMHHQAVNTAAIHTSSQHVWRPTDPGLPPTNSAQRVLTPQEQTGNAAKILSPTVSIY